MYTRFSKSFKLLRNEVLNHQLIYSTLFAIIILALFFRIYRVEALLGFYYDQGRDALVIWRLWHERDPFLVGPVTGLEGIFLGPLFYYLIAPFYLLGGGNPVVPAVFLSLLSVIAIALLYFIGWKFHSRATGLIAATIAAFSYYIVLTGRWLSNPNPIQLTSLLLLYSMYKVATHHDRRWWVAIALFIGVSLHFEAASAVFYFPMIIVFAIWRRRHLPSKKILIISVSLFILTVLPQIVFNFVHRNILLNNIFKIIFEEKSFSVDFQSVLLSRLEFFKTVLLSKLLPGWNSFAALFTFLSAVVIFNKRKELKRSKALPTLIIFLGVPMLGFVAFQGNHGNIYDYYMTGYYLPLILLFSLGLGILWEDSGGKISVLIFMLFFMVLNMHLILDYFNKDISNPNHVALTYQLKAVNWVYDNAATIGEFNVDVYVPPVIPYTYDYLFLWQGSKRCGKELCGLLKDFNVPLLYTLYEVDPPHPERLDAWLARQDGIGVVEEERRYGGIIVQRRTRYYQEIER